MNSLVTKFDLDLVMIKHELLTAVECLDNAQSDVKLGDYDQRAAAGHVHMAWLLLTGSQPTRILG